MEKITQLLPGCPASGPDMLTECLRAGARKILAAALEAEVEEYLARFAECRDEKGRRQVVRNGFQPERTIQTGIGDVPVKQPRVMDRRGTENGGEKFSPRNCNPRRKKCCTRYGCPTRARTRIATLSMVFKQAVSTEKGWRKLNGSELLAEVERGIRVVDGIKAAA